MERLPTGISGLDTVLAGGLLRGGIYLVLGRPGTGKTILGNHLAYNHARAGGVALFATILAETHGRMLGHLRSFGFFDQALVARHVHYINVFDELHRGGLRSTLDLFREAVREYRATLLVLDGVALLEAFASSPVDLHLFVYELQTHLAAVGCTAVLLSNDVDGGSHPLGTHVDGIILLADDRVQPRRVRHLEVVKIRGVDYLRGEHEFAITSEGIEVLPRLEATASRTPPPVSPPDRRLPFGIPGLDAMLQGGLPAGSTTLMIGSPGVGKTTIGLHFIMEGARRGERGMVISFHEPPGHLLRESTLLVQAVDAHLREQHVHVLWQLPVELSADAWSHRTLAQIDAFRPQRLFIDALSDVERLVHPPERLVPFFTALVHELRGRHITSILAQEAPGLLGIPRDTSTFAISALVENVILLRSVELDSRLRRLVCIVKCSGGGQDPAIRELTVRHQGVEVASPFEGVEALLSGFGHASRSLGRPQRRRGAGP